MIRIAATCTALLCCTAAPAQMADMCDMAQLGQARAALDAGRLVQVERMLGLSSASCGKTAAHAILNAELALARGQADGALEQFLVLAETEPDDPSVAAGAGRAALRAGDTELALDWLMAATASPEADWRAWNALAVALDRLELWEESALAYQRAFALAPDEPAIWNNRGYSLMLQDRPGDALSYFDGAVRLAPGDRRTVRNRTIARAMAGRYPRRTGEDDAVWAEQLNNAGYGAWLAGEDVAARSLFARALEARDAHFDRAERNLKRVEQDQ